MNPKTVFILARKDLLDALRTPRLLMIIAVPILVSLATNFFFNDTLTLRVAIFTPEASRLPLLLETTGVIKLTVANDAGAVRTAMENKAATLGVILPNGFDKAVENKELPTVVFLLADNRSSSQTSLSVVQQAIQALSPVPSPIVASVEVIQPNLEQSISLRGGLSLSRFAVIIWLVMGIVGNGIMLVPTLIVEERERKTLDALLISPTSYSEVVLGKALVGVVYSMLSGVIVLSSQGGFIGNIPATLLILFMGSLALSFVGLFIGGLAQNLNSLNSYGSLVLFPMILPGLVGMLDTSYVQYLQFLPTYHLVQGLALAMNGQADKVWPNIGTLAVLCALIFGAVVWSIKHREVA